MATEQIIGYGVIGAIALAAVLGLIVWIWEIVKTIQAKSRLNKELTWYRDIPVGGNLKLASYIMGEYGSSCSNKRRSSGAGGRSSRGGGGGGFSGGGGGGGIR